MRVGNRRIVPLHKRRDPAHSPFKHGTAKSMTHITNIDPELIDLS